MYDRSNRGASLRKVVFNTFGMWHPFKHMSLLVYTHFGRTVFGPLVHEFFPKSSVKLGWAKLKEALTYQTRVRLAFDSEVIKALDTALDVVRGNGWKIMESYLINLRDLGLFFLPEVRTIMIHLS